MGKYYSKDDIEYMRSEISKRYGGNWKFRVYGMAPGQVIAIYKSIQEREKKMMQLGTGRSKPQDNHNYQMDMFDYWGSSIMPERVPEKEVM